MKVTSNQSSSPIWNWNLRSPITAASELESWTCAGDSEHMRETQKISLPKLAATATLTIISLGYLSCGCTYHMSERIVKIIKEHKQNADRTEKEIFGIFGVINTIKITNGKSQWGSLLWFSLEIESFSFFFSFFCFFFFPFLFGCFTHTQSSFLEAASVRVSLFLLLWSLKTFFFFPVSAKKPRHPGRWSRVSTCVVWMHRFGLNSHCSSTDFALFSQQTNCSALYCFK